MSLLGLVTLVLGFNLLTFGNGPVMVPLLQRHLVEQGGILSLDQFLYAYALGRATPGQANLYVAALGYMTYGWAGALATIAAIQLPGYLMLPLVRGYERFRDVRAVRGFTRGLTAVSVSLMLSVTWDIGRQTLSDAITVDRVRAEPRPHHAPALERALRHARRRRGRRRAEAHRRMITPQARTIRARIP